MTRQNRTEYRVNALVAYGFLCFFFFFYLLERFAIFAAACYAPLTICSPPNCHQKLCAFNTRVGGNAVLSQYRFACWPSQGGVQCQRNCDEWTWWRSLRRCDNELSHSLHSCFAQQLTAPDSPMRVPATKFAEVRMRAELLTKCQIYSKFNCVCHLFDWLANSSGYCCHHVINHKTIQNARACFVSIH